MAPSTAELTTISLNAELRRRDKRDWWSLYRLHTSPDWQIALMAVKKMNTQVMVQWTLLWL